MALAGAARIVVVNRSARRGQELATLLNDRTPTQAQFALWDQPFAVPQDTDIVIHATSVGLYPDVHAMPAIDTGSLRPHMVVADGIHNPPLTRLLQAAQRQGCRTVDGLGMLVQQGVIGIKYWTGVDVDPEVMRQALWTCICNLAPRALRAYLALALARKHSFIRSSGSAEPL
ncbi:shikimate dehydrogenase family protein [Gemmobacter lanyuensis]